MPFVDPIDVITGELWTAVAHNLYLNANLRYLNQAVINTNPRWTELDVTGAFTITPAHVNARTWVAASGGPAYTIALPPADDPDIDVPCHSILIARVGSSDVTLAPSAGTIVGAATFVLAIQYHSINLIPQPATNNWVAF